MTGAVVILGATGRLGPAVRRAFEARGQRVISVGHGAAGFEAVNPACHDPDWWRDWLGFPPAEVAAVVNLVAGRQRSADEATAVGVGAVRAAAALVESAGATSSIHLGSVSEFGPGRLSAYAAGKRAARAEARGLRFTMVLTVGVVPRTAGDRHDAALRWFAIRIPSIAARLVDVSTPEEVGAAVAQGVQVDWRKVGYAVPAEVTLAGTPQTLGEVVGVTPSHRWYAGMLLELLARAPQLGGAQLARLVSFARQAKGWSSNHYSTRPPRQATDLVAVSNGWRLLSVGFSADLWLVPPQNSIGLSL